MTSDISAQVNENNGNNSAKRVELERIYKGNPQGKISIFYPFLSVSFAATIALINLRVNLPPMNETLIDLIAMPDPLTLSDELSISGNARSRHEFKGCNLRTDLEWIRGTEIREASRTCVRQQDVDRLLRLQQDPSLVHPVAGDASGRAFQQVHVLERHLEVTAVQPVPETNGSRTRCSGRQLWIVGAIR